MLFGNPPLYETSLVFDKELLKNRLKLSEDLEIIFFESLQQIATKGFVRVFCEKILEVINKEFEKKPNISSDGKRMIPTNVQQVQKNVNGIILTEVSFSPENFENQVGQEEEMDGQSNGIDTLITQNPNCHWR